MVRNVQSPFICFANCKSQNGLRKGPGGRSYHVHFIQKKTEALRDPFTPPSLKLCNRLNTQPHTGEHTHLSATKKKGRKENWRTASQDAEVHRWKKSNDVPSNGLSRGSSPGYMRTPDWRSGQLDREGGGMCYMGTSSYYAALALRKNTVPEKLEGLGVPVEAGRCRRNFLPQEATVGPRHSSWLLPPSPTRAFFPADPRGLLLTLPPGLPPGLLCSCQQLGSWWPAPPVRLQRVA